MSIIVIIFFSFLNNIINIPSPIKIDSSSPFFISSNEILFEFDYKSQEKTDMIFIFKPYSNGIISGKMKLFSDIELFQNESLNDANEKIFTQTFFFNGQNYITINSSDPFNIGKGKYYIYLIGNLHCSFEVFLLNEPKNLYINESYYFTNFFNYVSQNYYSLIIKNLTENIYMNILSYNKSCSSFEITKNNQKLKCESEISNILLLEKNNEYIIKYDLENFNYFSINFINYKSDFIQSLDEQNKINSFIALSNSLFNFSMNLNNYKVNDYFGFLIDYPIKFSLEGDYSEKENFEQFKNNIKKVGYNYFVAKKKTSISNYFIFKIKFLNSYYNKIRIKKIDEINFINLLPFRYNITKEKTYLFIFDEKLLNYFINYNSYIKLKFDQENSMNIFLTGYSKVLKDKIFMSKLQEIEAISFFNLDKEGIFEIDMLSENYNELTNTNYLIRESDKSYTRESNKGEAIEFIESESRKIFYCNLVMGNIDFYELFDLSENITEQKYYYNKINIFINQTFLLKAVIHSYSLYEIFFQNYDRNIHFITNSKMIYLTKFIKYSIFPSFDNMKICLKLMEPNSHLTFIHNGEEKILNPNNLFITLNNFVKFEIEGNNSLIYIFVSLSNDTNYLISSANNAEINNIREIFILPEKTNFDIINLEITITQSKQNEVILYYIVDYNIIPYSRNKFDLMKKITLKKDKKEYILINNYSKDDKAEHLSNETFYIYLLFEDNVSLNYQLNYSYYHILEENNQILISPGKNKIYIGYENINYLKFDRCGRQNISLDLYQNEEINKKDIIISDNSDLISCTKNKKEGYLSLEVNNQDNFLLSLSHQNISILDNFVYDYDIELSIDNYNKKVIVSYKPVSNFPQIEYIIFMVDKNYYYNLTDHCFINKYINEIYTKKFIFLSNGEEETFIQKLKIDGNVKCDEIYAFLIIAKEVINGYINYHYYNPKYIFISENICNAEPEETYEMSTEMASEIIKDNSGNISGLPLYPSSFFILGIDNFKHDKLNKKVYFNLYFVDIAKETYPNYIFLYVIINNMTIRNLESEYNEEDAIKTKCNLFQYEIKNIIKYECNFDTLGEEILNIKSLDIIEFNFQKINISFSSFLHYLYKNNIQNAIGNIFNKALYILEDSIIDNNENEFNITGKITEEFNYSEMNFQFHSDRDSEKIINSNCCIYKLDNKKYLLKCIPENKINLTIIDGYSNLSDGHFIVMFHNETNRINMKPNIDKGNFGNSSNKGLSAGAIVAIIISVIIIVAGIVVILLFIYKKKKITNIDNNTKGEEIDQKNSIK